MRASLRAAFVVILVSAPAMAQEAVPSEEGEPAAPETWLVWADGPEGPRTAWLVDDPSGVRVIATAPGRYIAHDDAIWELTAVARRVSSYDGACVLEHEDADVDAPPAVCAVERVMTSLQAREVDGDGVVVAPTSRALPDPLCDVSRTDEVMGSLGPFVFVRSCTYEYACYAAHGGVACEAHVLNLAAESAQGMDVVRDAGDVDGTLRDEAWTRASNDTQGMADSAADLVLAGVWPGWRDDGRLRVRLQYAGASCYACSDGEWSSYTESVNVSTDEVPELLRPYRHVPAPVRAWLEDTGAWPDGRFGFSELPQP